MTRWIREVMQPTVREYRRMHWPVDPNVMERCVGLCRPSARETRRLLRRLGVEAGVEVQLTREVAQAHQKTLQPVDDIAPVPKQGIEVKTQSPRPRNPIPVREPRVPVRAPLLGRPVVAGGGLLALAAAAALTVLQTVRNPLEDGESRYLDAAEIIRLGPSITLMGPGQVTLEERTDEGAVVSLEDGLLRASVKPEGPGRALVVRAADIEVSVHGTRFEVMRHEDDVGVQVHEGMVQVSDSRLDTVMTMGPGETWRNDPEAAPCAGEKAKRSSSETADGSEAPASGMSADSSATGKGGRPGTKGSGHKHPALGEVGLRDMPAKGGMGASPAALSSGSEADSETSTETTPEVDAVESSDSDPGVANQEIPVQHSLRGEGFSSGRGGRASVDGSVSGRALGDGRHAADLDAGEFVEASRLESQLPDPVTEEEAGYETCPVDPDELSVAPGPTNLLPLSPPGSSLDDSMVIEPVLQSPDPGDERSLGTPRSVLPAPMIRQLPPEPLVHQELMSRNPSRDVGPAGQVPCESTPGNQVSSSKPGSTEAISGLFSLQGARCFHDG